jgi:hypothetical protein
MRLEDSSEVAPGCNSAYGCVASKARNRDISFTPGFSPVSNDDKRRETVLNGFHILDSPVVPIEWQPRFEK